MKIRNLKMTKRYKSHSIQLLCLVNIYDYSQTYYKPQLVKEFLSHLSNCSITRVIKTKIYFNVRL